MTATGIVEPVTRVLLERARDSGGMRKMLTVSLAAHVVGGGVLILTSARLAPQLRQNDLRDVMTISLGGAPGPRSGGMTPMGGRPVPATPPPPKEAPPPRRPEPVRPPAAKPPAMTMPSPRERLKPPPRSPTTSTPDAKSRTPSPAPARPEPPQAGSAVAETGARGVGFGLTTGGGGAGGYLDVGNFCCPEYLTTMIQLIQRNWNSKQQIGADEHGQVHDPARRDAERCGARTIQRIRRARSRLTAGLDSDPPAPAAAGGVSQRAPDGSPAFPISTVMTVKPAIFVFSGLMASIVLSAAHAVSPLASAQAPAQAPPPQTAPAQQPSEVLTDITGEPGAPPRYAVPDFVALSNDAEVTAAAKTIGEVLWNDLDFEREFYMIPRDTYTSIGPGRNLEDVAFDRWRELGADGLIVGTVERAGTGIRVAVRLYSIRDRRSVFGKEYSGSAANPRLYAHTISDELHQQQRALSGVARTKLAFASDRDNERIAGTVQNRGVKEIYISDYDAANQRRVTVNRGLNITPMWTPDGRGIAYTSYRRGSPDIFISLIYQGTFENPTAGRG